MKITFKEFVALLITALLISWYCVLMSSCSPNYHMRKFIKKGGKVNCDTTSIMIHDTIKGKNGKDSIIYRTISVQCPELVAPPTRYEIRYRYKTIRDSFETIKYVTKFKYKEAVKTLKNDKKSSWGFNLRFWGVIVGLLFLIVYLLRTNKN